MNMAHQPRPRALVNGAVQTSDDATFRYTLPSSGALHTLWLKFRMTNGTTSAIGQSLHQVVDDIRIMADGSKILFSMNSVELEKYIEVTKGIPLAIIEDEGASNVQEIVYPIEFGRSYYDPEMWLPLSPFNEVEIEVDYSPPISSTVGFVTGTFTVDVIALISQNPPPIYKGTLINRHVKNFTPAASGDELTEIYRAYPLRSIFIYAYEAAVAHAANITNYILRIDSGEYDLFSMTALQLIAYNQQLMGTRLTREQLTFQSDTDTLDTRLSPILNHNVELPQTHDVSGERMTFVSIDTITGDQLLIDLADGDWTGSSEELVANTTNQDILISTKGSNINYGLILPFYHIDDPDFYLITQSMKMLELILTQGNAGGTCRISTQTVQKF